MKSRNNSIILVGSMNKIASIAATERFSIPLFLFSLFDSRLRGFFQTAARRAAVLFLSGNYIPV